MKNKIILWSMLIFVYILFSFTSYYLCHYVRKLSHKPTISVIMSTYNRTDSYGEDLLSRSVNSILRQTYKDFEFIIINDGSDDKTAEVLKRFAQQDKRIIVLTNPQNKGLPYSLNKGLDIAKGKYIARMDDDDFSVPSRFDKQVRFLDENPHISATGCSLTFNGKDPLLFPSDPDEAKAYTFTKVPVLHPCAMFRRDFIEKHNIRYVNTYPNAEDMPFWYDFTIVHNGLISNLPDMLLYKKANAKKAKNYGSIQNESVRRYQNDAFKKIIKDKPCNNFCECYKSLAKSEEIKKIMDVEKLKTYMNKHFCPSGNTIFVHHPQWEDYFVFDSEKRIHRFSSKDKATILEKTPKHIKIKWDKWGTETFVKNKDNIYIFKK
ncbi:MAG: glycosyltransferase family 2 protein [Alphaproteobacteria bacterium]|nr:glycosyltransferase family 2 protein [Alphaproteobacteria bacterium]